MKVTKAKLEKILREYPEVELVEISEDGRLATLTSRAFLGVDEADRQEKIWAFLHEHLDEEELYSVEFVFTNAPGDQAEAA